MIGCSRVNRVPLLTPGNCLFLIAILAVLHLTAIIASAVNLPFMDEWEMLRIGALGDKLDWAWVFRPHNEHRIVFTKILTWLMLKLTAWHHIAMLVLNFGLYLLSLLAFVSVLQKANCPTTGAGPSVWAALGLSALSWENHSWGFQSQFHFFLLFYFAALLLVIRGGRWAWLAGPLAVASAFSFSSGILCAAAVAGLMTARCALGYSRWRSVLPQVALIALGITLWMSGFEKNPGHPAFIWPWDGPVFWAHFLTMIGTGWALPSQARIPMVSLVLTFIIVHYIMIFFGNFRKNRTEIAKSIRESLLTLAFCAAGLLATGAVTSLARGEMGVQQAESSRYTEFTYFLLPLVWVSFSLTPLGSGAGLARFLNRRQATILKWGCGILIVAAFAPWFSFGRAYKWHKKEMTAGRACVAQFYAGEPHGGANCPTIYIAPLDEQLQRARELNLAFPAEYRINSTSSSDH